MRRQDFPIFKTHKNLVYLDTAATAQKPKAVLKRVARFLERENAPVHRSLYPLGEKATAAFEGVREQVAAFIGARDAREVVFVHNATEALNVVAQAWGRANVGRGDELLVTRMEHHANFVPWLTLAKEKGAKLTIVELTADGRLNLNDFKKKLSGRTKVVAVTHVSNVLGTINPISRISRLIREAQSSKFKAQKPIFVVDAAQSAAHLPINVRGFGCDFLVFSSHKLYGPSGCGVLWGKYALLDAMPPFLTGGHMIETVTDRGATWNAVPHKFEAGTPPAEAVIGLGAAIEYVERLGWNAIRAHERKLMRYALGRFADPKIRRFVRVLGSKKAEERSGVISFTVKDVHPHDAASLLAEEGIAVRAGHHCAMPLHTQFGLAATVRLSFGVYNDRGDIDRFFAVLTERVLPLSLT